ncbi:MAG: fused MFS/spermidine synthase [Gallionellaceae bacterium]|nr:fused MFS/spermidine synthase [Gallionellaceae bacterium]
MSLYALTIFVSAFLLFLLQLITAKQILPWFGGSAAVWATCLVFFQSVLLFGYAYADWSIRQLTAKRQTLLHVTLLVLSLLLLPIMPDVSWKPGGSEDPAWRIVQLLTVTIGLPYFLLSTTSPLIQAWFAQAYPDKSPYRLFALSNFASMLALLGYPLLIEPWLSTTTQAQTWSVIYIVFVALCGATAWHSWRSAHATVPAAQPATDENWEPPPTVSRQFLWMLLAAMGSLLLLAVTNHLSQDVAAIPLLWVLPLSIYLLTFILCFDGRGWYKRNLFLGLLAVVLCAMAWALIYPPLLTKLMVQIGLFLTGLFIACMFCHGELNRLRPAPRYLTRFYLMVSLGGAAGAILVGLITPLIMPGFYELGIGLALLAALGLYQMRHQKPIVMGISTAVLLFTSASAIYHISTSVNSTLAVKRNFYGVVRVYENKSPNPDQYRRMLTHGLVMQGDQYPAGRWRRTPITYYRPTSGLGRTLLALPPNARVGAIGLGAGTIAAFGRLGDVYRFYEINPAVIQIANQQFTYLADSAAKIEMVLGDARLSLEREPDQQFDVLVVDAFSSAAIPTHLITREALAVYLRDLKPGGVIAFNVNNLYLDLAPMVQQIAHAHNLKAASILEERKDFHSGSHWVLVSADPAWLALPTVDLPVSHSAAYRIQSRPEWRLWTDDFSNLLQVLK